MSTIDPAVPIDPPADADLARRLERYRRRVEAEGRPRSVKVIDRAIEAAGKPLRERK
jgi:hypothetical protein